MDLDAQQANRREEDKAVNDRLHDTPLQPDTIDDNTSIGSFFTRDRRFG